MGAIADYLLKQKALYTSLSFPTDIVDVQPFIWKDFNLSLKYTYRLDLKNKPQKLLENFSPERRKNITKAGKDGLVVKLADDPVLVSNLVLQSIVRKNAPMNKELIKKIIAGFLPGNHAFAFVAFQDDTPLATVFVIHDNQCAYYLFGGFDQTNKHQGAGASCMWQAILHAQNSGLKIFDFEGSMLPDVERYFRGFGAEIKPLINIHSASYFMQIILKSKGKQGF